MDFLVGRADGPPPPSRLFTPFLVGFFFATILYGVICSQVATYYSLFWRRDVWWLKALLAYLFVCETFMTIAEFVMCYEPFIDRWGEPQALAISPIMLPADGIGTVLISTPVQIYLGWRLRRVTQNNVLFLTILLLALVSLAGGLLVGYNVIVSPEFRTFSSFTYAPIMWLASSAVCDVVISGGLVWFLFRNKAGFSNTKTVLDKIIISTVQSGIVTSVAAVLTLVVFLSIPKTTLMFIFDFSLSKLYYTSLLSTLISRKHWNDLITKPINNSSTDPISLGDIRSGRKPESNSMHGRGSRSTGKIEITTQMERVVSPPDFDNGKHKIYTIEGNTFNGDPNNPVPEIKGHGKYDVV